MTEERQTQTLESLVQRYSLLHGNPQVNSHFNETDDDVSWEDIWEVALAEKLVTTDIIGRTRLFSIPACRRGPAVMGDPADVARVAEETGSALKEYQANRFPHVPLAQDLGYLIKGLPHKEQLEILQALQVQGEGGQLYLNSKGSSLVEISQQDNSPLLWSLPSSRVRMSHFRSTMSDILEITHVDSKVVQQILPALPQECSFEEAMIRFSNRTVEFLLKEWGYDIRVDTSPLQVPSFCRIDARKVESEVRSALTPVLNIEGSSWYPSFRGSVRKLLRGYYEVSEKDVARVWEKLAKNFPQAAEAVTFSTEEFMKRQLTGALDDAFMDSLGYTADIGITLYKSATAGIRLNGDRDSGPSYLPYTHGREAVPKIFEKAAKDVDLIIGFQRLSDRLHSGLLMLTQLSQIVKERGQAVPGIMISRKDSDKFDISIIQALKVL